MIADFWYEIWEVIKRKPSRVILTSIGISWGIFILIMLVGVGAGFERGVFKLFEGYSRNTTYVFAAQTSKAYKGINVGKPILFSQKDLKLLVQNIPDITMVSPEISRWESVFSDNGKGTVEIRAVYPDYFNIKILEIDNGRMLNALDMEESRRCVIIGKNVADVLFNHEQPVGKLLHIKKEVYQVVGVIKKTLQSVNEERVIYIPYTTYLQTNAGAKEFTTMLFATHDYVDTKDVNIRVRDFLSRMNKVAPDDDNAFYFNSREEQVRAFKKFFEMFRKFLWFMGISTLLSGIIGVGNVMYMSVKERTREIGIRKSIGAKASAIKAMVLWESVALTSISGYLGMLLGWICLQGVGLIIDDDTLMMDKPGIDLLTTVIATLILTVSGTLAGLKPAMYASDLSPIDALKEEN